jgi:hypothetical protein
MKRLVLLAMPILLAVSSANAAKAPRMGEGAKEFGKEKGRMMEQSKDAAKERRGSATDATTAEIGLPASNSVIAEDAEFVGPKATPAQFKNSVLDTLNEMRNKPEVESAAREVMAEIQSNPNAVSVVAQGWMTTCKNLSPEALRNGLSVLAVGAKNVGQAAKEVYRKGLARYEELTGQGKESYCQLRQGQQCALFAGPLVAGCI